MRVVKLKEDRPFGFRGSFIWLHRGDLFEVVAEKDMPMVGNCYNVRLKEFPSMVLDGWNRALDFEEVKK